jgi:hypothetical protein
MNHTPNLHGPGYFEIRIQGRLDARWADSFEATTVESGENGITVVSGWFPDQAALHGAIEALRDLGLPLISVIPIEAPPL